MEFQERLRIFFERLSNAAPPRTAREGMDLVCTLIEDVEAEFCPVSRIDPPPRHPTGRMYAPQADLIEAHQDGSLRASTVKHRITCGPDGSITIIHRATQSVELHKPGASR